MDDFSNFNSEDIYEHIDDLIIDTEKVISWIKSEPNTTRD
jgi:hypothetical protein